MSPGRIQVRIQLEEIAEMIRALQHDTTTVADARNRILTHPKSIEVRSGWKHVGEPFVPREFCILVRAARPSVRILGELNRRGQAIRSHAEYREGEHWAAFGEIDDEQSDALQAFCNCFYFGD